MKICNCCHLPDKEYTSDKRNKGGLQGICNDCKNSKRRLKYFENPEPLKEKQKRYNGYALEKGKKHIETLSDTYIIAELKRGTELTTVDIRKHPELIQLKRQIILNKRLIKNEKRKGTQRKLNKKI